MPVLNGLAAGHKRLIVFAFGHSFSASLRCEPFILWGRGRCRLGVVFAAFSSSFYC